MKLRLSTGIAALLCVLMASCYPVDENGNRIKATRKPQQTAAEEAKKKEEEARKKAEEEMKKKKEEAEKKETEGQVGGDGGTGAVPPTGGGTTGGGTTTSLPIEQKRTDYAFATKVPGKEGFVFSPYNNRVVDVRDIPSGTLVQDPTYPASEKKYFRVP